MKVDDCTTLKPGGTQAVDGQVTGDVPIELVSTSQSTDNVYSGLINMVDMTAGPTQSLNPKP